MLYFPCGSRFGRRKLSGPLLHSVLPMPWVTPCPNNQPFTLSMLPVWVHLKFTDSPLLKLLPCEGEVIVIDCVSCPWFIPNRRTELMLLDVVPSSSMLYVPCGSPFGMR